MQYFIGVLPPEGYKKEVTEFREKWINNSINDVVEPHITIKAQGGLTTDEGWVNKVKEICAETETFHVSFDGLMFFGDEVHYVNAAAEELHLLHESIVKAISPSKELIEKYFELDDFVPHMTLGKTTYGLTKPELKDMAEEAEKNLAPFPCFEVDFIRIYLEEETNKYRRYLDVTLGALSN
ncbi:2'-5' RNA ligase [Halobacillus litoralis]|uniref:2'-5' RNA ligase n=1 Tax=Halobacillus litoralis TaxID=45668 RepID=A0A410MIM4_9BACI|nr:2'-5' RNA ligase [Halobacillus litoralis]